MKLKVAEMHFEEFLEEIGIDDQMYEYTSYDDYDYSFELKGCEKGLELTKVQKLKCKLAGFHQAWLCYKDGTEKYYGF